MVIREKGKELKGYFHRFVYQSQEYYSFTRVLVELENGRLKYFDPEFVQFTDRKRGKPCENRKSSDDESSLPFQGS